MSLLSSLSCFVSVLFLFLILSHPSWDTEAGVVAEIGAELDPIGLIALCLWSVPHRCEISFQIWKVKVSSIVI